MSTKAKQEKPNQDKIKAPRGTQDILPTQSPLWQLVEHKSQQVLGAAGFKEIRTPIFESTSLFARAVGEDSDIVNKEMYSFMDKGDRSMTLRPENTAGVVRSFIEHSLERGQKPVKLWYSGPMFRYERPQAGRYRQFHQIGAEAFGLNGPYIDLEIISLGVNLLQSLGLDKLRIRVNSLGTAESRIQYRDALVKFLEPLQDKVCEDCQRRFKQNPLRCLDCKDENDQKLYKDAPKVTDYLDEESSQQWTAIKEGLEELFKDNKNLNFIEDPNLVRGLDYYNHVVFEIETNDPELEKALGQQSTVLAGGRYDNLVETLGGKPSPGIGWSLGVERLVMLLEKKHELDAEAKKKSGKATHHDSGIYIISDDVLEAQKLAIQLRKILSPHMSLQTTAEEENFVLPNHVEFDFDSAKIGKQLEKATKRGCRFAIFYLEDERKSGKFKLKDLETKEETESLDMESLIKKIMYTGIVEDV